MIVREGSNVRGNKATRRLVGRAQGKEKVNAEWASFSANDGGREEINCLNSKAYTFYRHFSKWCNLNR